MVLYKSPVSFAAEIPTPAQSRLLSPLRTQAASVYTAVQDFWNNLFNTPAPEVPAANPSLEVQPPSVPLPPSPVVTTFTPPQKVSVPTVAPTRPPTQVVVTTTSTRLLSGVTATDLETQITALRSELLSEIARGKTQATADNNALYLAMAPMNRINNLSSVTLSSPTITNASLTGSTIAGYLPTAGGTMSGDLVGTTGSFTTLGIGTTTPSDTFAVNGVTYLADVSAPSVTTNRLYSNSGNLYWAGSVIGGSVGSWTLSGSDVYRVAGNVGIGTTSPFTTLSVTGDGYFSGALNVGATSTTRSNLGLTYASRADVINNMNIAAWGDSLTGGSGVAYLKELALLTNKNIYNGGVGGETSTGIKNRMIAATDKYSYPTIIWAGRNNYSSPTTVKADIATMVAALTSVGNSNYIVLSVLNGPGEPSGNANYTTITQLNTDLAAVYGSHYLDVRTYLITNGLSDAGITPTAQDTTDINNDVPPTSLRADSIVHLNTAGYVVVAKYVFQNISLLQGYLATLVTTNNLQNLFAQSVNVSGFVNTDKYSGFQQNGITILYASTTNTTLSVGSSGAASWMSATSTSFNSIAIGDGALSGGPISAAAINNVAVGINSLYYLTTGTANSALGQNAARFVTTGSYNSAVGLQSLYNDTIGERNSAVGAYALSQNTTGSYNVAMGMNALNYNNSATSTVAVGAYAAQGNSIAYSNQGGVYLGYFAGYKAATGSDYNTFIGYQSGYGVTTGTRNVFIGQSTNSASYNQVTTGSRNIAIGNDVMVPNSTASYQLNIGNLIYGTGLDGTGAAISTGKIGIGTTTPYAKLSVHANSNETNTTLFAIASSTASATTTLFTVRNTGNVGIGTAAPAKSLQVIGDIRVGTSGTNGCVENFAGTALTGVCSSDASLKTNIQPLGSVLPGLVQLTPSTFYWNDLAGNELHNSTTTLNYGLIAQDVERVLPGMVATTSNGYLGVNYSMLPILTLQGLKELDLNLEGLASTTTAMADATGEKTFAGRFFDRMTGWLADTANGITKFFAKSVETEELCVRDASGAKTCIDKAQLDSLLSGRNTVSGTSMTVDTTATSTPITISINGNNPATLNIGDTYGDLGALIISPESAKNFGIKASIDGGVELDISQISLDTSVEGTHTITYSVIDQNNATTTAERVVNVLSPELLTIETQDDTATTTVTQ